MALSGHAELVGEMTLQGAQLIKYLRVLVIVASRYVGTGDTQERS